MDKEVAVLAMSDEDFLKMNGPESMPDVEQEPVIETPKVEVEEPQPGVVPEVTEETQTPNPETLEEEEQEEETQQPPAQIADDGKQTQEPKVDVKPEPVVAAPVVSEEPDYKAFYELAMKPIKANGKEINLKTPQELIQLAQMGANYTRKMQELAPQRKLLLMLQNNGLLDEGKLSYLIDIDKKNPEAIKKLIADAGIDPMDIDTTVAPSYTTGNHRVTDEEAAFSAALDEMSSNTDGQAVLQAINSTWDQASKEQLYKQPAIMEVMLQQRQAGFYDRIVSEMDRQRALGYIPAGQPWLQSYKQVGDQLATANAFDDLVEKPNVKPQTPAQPVATTVAAPKATVVPNAKATAAAPSRATPAQAKVVVNPLSMSDEDFMKQMANRL